MKTADALSPKLAALGAAALLLALLPAAPAEARSNFPGYIPKSGEVNTTACGICHVSSSGGGTRTSFGLDVQSNLSGGVPDWGAIYNIDSDGDGFTNGEELCDPMGTWMAGDGDPDPSCMPTLPGDDSDFPPMMMPEDMGTPGEVDMGTPGEVDMGGGGEVDMSAPIEEDMDTATPGDMSSPGNGDPGNSDPGNSAPGNSDPGNSDPGGVDMGSEMPGGGSGGGGGAEDDEPACAQGGVGAPAGSGLGLLGLLGLVALGRRRR